MFKKGDRVRITRDSRHGVIRKGTVGEVIEADLYGTTVQFPHATLGTWRCRWTKEAGMPLVPAKPAKDDRRK